MKPYEEIDKALKVISSASNRWEYEQKQGPLWNAANHYPKEMIESYYKYPEHQLSIAWCLANIKKDIIKEFFLKEARNKDQYIRWYSIINLRKYKSKDVIEVFLQGLKDRASLVKSESISAVKNIEDPRIEKALTHLVNLKSFKKNSPGSFNEANEILQKYKNI